MLVFSEARTHYNKCFVLTMKGKHPTNNILHFRRRIHVITIYHYNLFNINEGNFIFLKCYMIKLNTNVMIHIDWNYFWHVIGIFYCMFSVQFYNDICHLQINFLGLPFPLILNCGVYPQYRWTSYTKFVIHQNDCTYTFTTKKHILI